MKTISFPFGAGFCLALLALLSHGTGLAQTSGLSSSESLNQIVRNSVNLTLREYKGKGLKPSDLAVTVIDLGDPSGPAKADVRGEASIYPASVVKIFYMAAIHHWEESGRLEVNQEVRRGLSDMITVSSNDATGYILDVLTETSSGAELPAREFAEWSHKREAVNRHYRSLGYENVNVNQKTFCEDAYGVEQQFRNYKGENRNMLTTDATARLMMEIVTGKSVTEGRSREMMKLMRRDWEKPVDNPEDKEFISHALEPGARLWSKEGWTSRTRHDAAYIETPDGRKVIIVIFTQNFAKEIGIIPGIARMILKSLKKEK